MPCYSEPHSYCDHTNNKCIERCISNNCKKELDIEKENLQQLKEYTDNICRMLCEVMGKIEYQSPWIVIDKDIAEWWEKHKKWDERRQELGLKK
jgi:hypothetical protein